MPKHYCDYCDVFLTHDSTSVRKAHNSGRNHLSNVRDYYASLGHDKAQNIIDQITSAYESGGGPPPGGFGFGPQHLGVPPPPQFGGPMGAPFGRPGFPPPGPGGFPMAPFPPAGGLPGGPPGPGFPGLPPFPPGGLPPPGVNPNGPPPAGFPPFPPPMPPFAPQGAGGPPAPPGFGGPPNPPSEGGQANATNGPSIHPDRLRMMGNGSGPSR